MPSPAGFLLTLSFDLEVARRGEEGTKWTMAEMERARLFVMFTQPDDLACLLVLKRYEREGGRPIHIGQAVSHLPLSAAIFISLLSLLCHKRGKRRKILSLSFFSKMSQCVVRVRRRESLQGTNRPRINVWDGRRTNGGD